MARGCRAGASGEPCPSGAAEQRPPALRRAGTGCGASPSSDASHHQLQCHPKITMQRMYLFFTGEQSQHPFFFLNKMNLQATCRLCQHKAAFRRVIQPPPASLGLCSSLHYPIFFFFLILHKKNASQLLTHPPWTVSARQARHPPQMAARAPALPQVRFLKGSTAADA